MNNYEFLVKQKYNGPTFIRKFLEGYTLENTNEVGNSYMVAIVLAMYEIKNLVDGKYND